MKKIIYTLKIIIVCIFVGTILLAVLSYREKPEKVTYGMSFSKFRTDELHLPFEETFLAILNDLGVQHFRFSAHWPLTEPEEGVFNFKELDYQMSEALRKDAQVVFAVGRRLPRWPECHDPHWVEEKSIEQRNNALLHYIEVVVNRYKDYPNILYWQVENEPFLSLFAYDHCGEVDEEFLREEIALVKTLDPERSVLVTDSGNLGTWHNAYQNGDVFGTSLYRYFWTPELGTFMSRLPAFFYDLKYNIMNLIYGRKDGVIIELSMEPWLTDEIVNTSISVQFERMDIEKMEEIADFARKTGFDTQFLWGAEWWYWMKEHGHPQFWEKGKGFFEE